MVSAVTWKNDDGLPVSYNIALPIAKAGKAHTIGETLIAPVIHEVMTTALKKDPEPVFRAISLTNSTVQRRIDEMTTDTERNLCNTSQNMDSRLQLDESTSIQQWICALGLCTIYS